MSVKFNLDYRPEVDGLRAISVISVLFFHAKFKIYGYDLLINGYFGVDIFFIISGYLISKQLIKEINLNLKINFKIFFLKRILRIIPALLFLVIVSSIVAYNLLIPREFVNFSKFSLSSIFFYSNYFSYFTNVEYNNDGNLYYPLNHIWSLSIEEQFYFIFPFLLTIIFFLKKNKLLAIISILIIFFLLSNYFTYLNSSFSYYFTLSRIFEFFIGFLIAYINFYKIKFFKLNFSADIGLFLIFISVMFPYKINFHPSLLTLFPLLGASLILISRKSSFSILSKFVLLNPLSIFIGKISFSLYLWHFPIFSFFRIYKNKEPSTISENFLILILIILMTLISYFFIEKIFRYNSIKFIKNRFKLLLIFFVIFSLSLFNFISIKNDGFSKRFPEKVRKIIETDFSKLLRMHTNLNENLESQFQKIYEIKDNGKKNIIFLGDSTIGQPYIEFKNLNLKKYNVMLLSEHGCNSILPTKLDYSNDTLDVNCSEYNNYKKFELIKKLDDPIVIYHFRYADFLNKKKNSEFINNEYLKNLNNTINFLERNSHLILIYPIPEFEFNPIRRFFKNIRTQKSDFLENINFKYSDYLKKNYKIIKIFDENNKHHKIISSEIFCKDKKKCNSNNSDDFFYIDQVHLSDIGSKMLINKIFKELKYKKLLIE